jgi:hypothetical protein
MRHFDVTIAGGLNLDLILYGDAGFLHQYLRGSDVKACLIAGNLAGALSVTRAGGTEAFRDAQHRERFLQEYRAFYARSL